MGAEQSLPTASTAPDRKLGMALTAPPAPPHKLSTALAEPQGPSPAVSERTAASDSSVSEALSWDRSCEPVASASAYDASDAEPDERPATPPTEAEPEPVPHPTASLPKMSARESSRLLARRVTSAIQSKQAAVSSIVAGRAAAAAELVASAPAAPLASAKAGGKRPPVKRWPTVTPASGTPATGTPSATTRVMARYDVVTNTLHGMGNEIVRAAPVHIYQGITPPQTPRIDSEASSPSEEAKRDEMFDALPSALEA